MKVNQREVLYLSYMYEMIANPDFDELPQEEQNLLIGRSRRIIACALAALPVDFEELAVEDYLADYTWRASYLYSFVELRKSKDPNCELLTDNDIKSAITVDTVKGMAVVLQPLHQFVIDMLPNVKMIKNLIDLEQSQDSLDGAIYAWLEQD